MNVHQLLGVAVLVVLVIAAIPLYRRNKRVAKHHTDEMQSWAESHGCNYALEDDSQYDGHTFYPFDPSEHQWAHRVITGTYAGRTIAAYDLNIAQASTASIYFAMVVMQLPTTVPWLHVTERKNLHHRDVKDAISTGDEAFDGVYAVFGDDQEFAKSAMSPTVRAGLPAQALSGMHIVNGRLFLWHTRRQHEVALLDDRLRFAATIVAELPAG
jgi:hypothetical protein